jgi:hypothetical protein
MAVGALIGGTLGGKLAGRIKPSTLRWTVVVIGVVRPLDVVSLFRSSNWRLRSAQKQKSRRPRRSEALSPRAAALPMRSAIGPRAAANTDGVASDALITSFVPSSNQLVKAKDYR